jgi:hypothetical protein
VKQKQPLILLFSTGQVEVGLLLMLTMEEAQVLFLSLSPCLL